MNQSFIQKFLSGSAFSALGTAITVIFHFVSIVLLTRYVTKAELGFYFLLLAIANGGKIISSFGLDLTLTQKIATQNRLENSQSLTIILVTRLIILILLGGFFYLISGTFLTLIQANELANYQLAIPLIFALMSLRELFFSLIQGLQYFKTFALIQTFSAIFKFGLIFLFANSLNLNFLVLVEILMLVSSLLIQLVFIPWKELPISRNFIKRKEFTEIYRFGFPLYVNGLMTYLSNFGGVFIISYFLNPVSIAFYEVAGKIPQGLSRLFASFKIVYFPSLSKLMADRDFKGAQKLMNTCLILMSAGLPAIVLGSNLFSYEIILLLFSESYLETQLTFSLLVFAVCMQLIATTMGYTLVAAGEPKSSMIANLIGLSLEFALSILLIPVFGYIGAAISFAITALLLQFISYWFLKRINLHLNVLDFMKPFAFLVTFISINLWLPSNSFSLRLGLLITYLMLCFIFINPCRQAFNYFRTLIANRGFSIRAT